MECIRTSESPDYSPTSDHTFGKAVDIIFDNCEAVDVREDLRKNWVLWAVKNNLTFPLTIEEGPSISWLHGSVRNSAKIFNEFYVGNNND